MMIKGKDLIKRISDKEYSEDLIKELEKYEVKKPNNDLVDGKCCPTCLERATFQTWKLGLPTNVKMKFCQNCGQALDWSEE